MRSIFNILSFFLMTVSLDKTLIHRLVSFIVVIDRYRFFFRTDTDYLYVYVPDNRYLFTVIE